MKKKKRKSVRFLFCPAQLNLISSSKKHYFESGAVGVVLELGSHSEITQTAPRGCIVNRIATIERIYEKKRGNLVVILKCRAIPLEAIMSRILGGMSDVYSVWGREGYFYLCSLSLGSLPRRGGHSHLHLKIAVLDSGFLSLLHHLVVQFL